MFKEMFLENEKTNEAFGVSFSNIDSVYQALLNYLDNEYNIKRVIQKGDTLKVDIDNNISSSELEEIEDKFDDFVFSINRRNHVLEVEPA